jgi:para-nitrobenzyl esterase
VVFNVKSPLASRFGISFVLANLAFGCADVEDQNELGTLDETLVEESIESASRGGGAPLATVREGKLQGKLVNTTRVFLNVPYAKPPVGELRFAAPQPAAPWAGIRQATAFGPSCPQPASALGTPGPQSEDCLSLNVFTPKSGSKHPVMVFIPGGAFVVGGSASYDGQKLSESAKAIVVTLNYRLGALGLLSHPALDAQRGSAPSGNDAIRDQQLALTWIKNNIGAFGGDASNVTLMGESAGSMSACLNMVSPTSRTLAQRFVMESAACVGGLPLNTKAQAQAVGTGLAQAFCSDATDVVACLRSKSAAELIAWGADRGISGAGWAPVVNAADPVLPAHPIALISSGNYNKGPIILGTNKREWGLFQAIGQAPAVPSVAALSAVIDGTFGPIAPYVKGQYAATATDATANETYIRLMTDYVFRCPTRALARLTTSKGSRAYLYSFEEGAAYHAFEIPYVFNTPNPTLGAPTLVEPLRQLVQTGLSNFARTGNPNPPRQNYWPAYDTTTDNHAVLIGTPTIGSGLAKADCDFWAYIATLST